MRGNKTERTSPQIESRGVKVGNNERITLGWKYRIGG